VGKCGRLISVAISGYVWCVLLPIITPHLEEPEFLRLLEYLDTENILLGPGKECVLGAGVSNPPRPMLGKPPSGN
jgi:hypothetical protein